MTQAQKVQNTKNLNAMKSYFADLLNAVLTQNPQSNGRVYLHGEIITLKRLNDAVKELNEYCKIKNTYSTKKELIGLVYTSQQINSLRKKKIIL